MEKKINDDIEKKYWLKIDRENKIFQSNKAIFFGGFLVIFFSYEYVKLYLGFSSNDEFINAIQTTEKTRSLGFTLLIVIGILFIWDGINIRKSPLSDQPRELP